MKDKYTHIFEPLTVRTMTIKNRICMMPMGTNYGEQNGEMSFLHIDYYRQRAKGGTGLLIVENANVDFPQVLTVLHSFVFDHDNYLPRLYKVLRRYASLRNKKFLSRLIMLVLLQCLLVSADFSQYPHLIFHLRQAELLLVPLTKDEILAIVKKYGEAAKRAQTAGFDAVEIHAGPFLT